VLKRKLLEALARCRPLSVYSCEFSLTSLVKAKLAWPGKAGLRFGAYGKGVAQVDGSRSRVVAPSKQGAAVSCPL
jgi:hypothetical protein